MRYPSRRCSRLGGADPLVEGARIPPVPGVRAAGWGLASGSLRGGLSWGCALAWLLGCTPLPAPTPRAEGPEATAAVGPRGEPLPGSCVPTGPELCFNAVDDNCNGLLDEGCGARTGLLQFVIAWDSPTADVDLQVIDPNGELIEVGRVAKSGLTKQQDCPGEQDACRGQNFENVYLDMGDPLQGAYQVTVRLERLGAEAPPIAVQFGARIGPKSYASRFELDRPDDEARLGFEL